jgi:hypothetical protein
MRRQVWYSPHRLRAVTRPTEAQIALAALALAIVILAGVVFAALLR